MTDWNNEQWKIVLLSKATGSQTHILSKFELSTGKKTHQHFLLVTENKQKYRLEKMKAVLTVSGF